MHIGVQNEAQAKYINTTIDSKKGIKHKAPNKAQFIVHELISQIPCFQNYEGIIMAYVKLRRSEDYSGTEM